MFGLAATARNQQWFLKYNIDSGHWSQHDCSRSLILSGIDPLNKQSRRYQYGELDGVNHEQRAQTPRAEREEARDDDFHSVLQNSFHRHHLQTLPWFIDSFFF